MSVPNEGYSGSASCPLTFSLTTSPLQTCFCIKTNHYICPAVRYFSSLCSAGFTYRLDRLKPRASKFRRPPAKVYNMFNTVIDFSHLCCHKVLYFLNNLSVIFLTQLHSISEYCRILNIKHFHRPPVVKVGYWEGPHKWNTR